MTLAPTLSAGPPEAGPATVDARAGGVPRAVAVAAMAALVGGAQASVAVGAYLHFLSPLVGFAACFAVPLVLVHRLLGRRDWSLGGERFAVAVALTLLLLMLAGLADDLVLPPLGISRPLGTWPVLITADLVDAGLVVATFRSMPRRWLPPALPFAGWRSRLCLVLAYLTVPLAAMGAVRLNNGAGGGLTVFTLCLVVVVMCAMLRWRDLMDGGAVPLALYAISLALLFMTSLRGWYTTGHDVQQEMQAFLRTSQPARWTTAFHDGYNSCLSITILPTVMLRWTRVADPYVFKVFFQVLYAVCPVAVYYVARRITSQAMSLISTFFFIGFVSYLQDMPMLNRQEIGFIFFATSLVMLFMGEWPRRWRWTLFCVLGTGMVVSHYSTSYWAVAALIGALLVRAVAARALPRAVPPWRRLMEVRPPSGLLSWRLAAILLVLTVVWDGPINHDGNGLVTVVSNAIHNAVDHGSSTRAAEAGYSIAGPGRGATQADAYRQLIAAETAARNRHPNAYVPAPPPSRSLTPPAPTAALPLTSLGKAITGSASTALRVNKDWRTAAAWGLQLLMAAGLVVVMLRRRYAAALPPDALFLGVAMVCLLVVQVVLPSISLDYGVGRSFMQAMMILGPFMAIGSAVIAGLVTPRWRVGLALGLFLTIFVSTSGIVPQLLGGYPPQLHLNNAGDYYDRYYLHPQEVSAVDWLKSSVIARSPRYPDIQTDVNLLNESRSLGGLRAFGDVYPSDIRKDAYVILGYATVTGGRSLEVVDGYELWLHYPTAVLQQDKSLIYSNGGTQIYR